MKKDYLLSSNSLTHLILSKMPLLAKTRINVNTAKLITIEFLTLAGEHKGDINRFLSDNFFYDDQEVMRSIGMLLEEIIDDISIYCPELINVIERNDRLSIENYSNHAFVLSTR